MKKLISVVLVLVMALSAISSIAEEFITGGWNQCDVFEQIPEEAQRVFDKATGELMGVNYEAVALLSTQIVAGINYMFLCKETYVTPDAETFWSYIYINQDLDDNCTVEYVDTIAQVNEDGELVGGWTMQDIKPLDETEAKAFETAVSELMGVSYEPVAVLATQVVAGVNYMFLSKATVIYPDAVPYWAVLYVYAALDGTAQVTDIRALEQIIDNEGEFTDYNPEIRTVAESCEITADPENEQYICDLIFEQDVTVSGSGCNVWFINCEFKANVINAAETSTFVWIDSSCDIAESTVLKLASGVKEANIEYSIPKFAMFNQIPVECEGIGGVIMVGTDDILINGEAISIADAQYTEDADGNIFEADPNAEYFMHIAIQWYENGEKVVFTMAE